VHRQTDSRSRSGTSAARAARSPRVFALCLLATLACGAPSWAANSPAPAAPPPASAFGALPANTEVVMSPSGERLAWVDHEHDKPRVVMFDVGARRELRVLALPERLKLRRLLWNDNDTLLITFSETAESKIASQASREYFINVAYDVSGGDGRMLPAANLVPGVKKTRTDQAAVSAYLVRLSVAAPHTVVMATHICHAGIGCLVAVDTGTGEPTVVKSGNEHTVGWIVDRNGQPVAREDWDFLQRVYRVYALSGNSVKEILRRDDNDAPDLAGILPDDSSLVLLAANGRPHQVAWSLPLDGSPPTVLAEDADADIEGVYTDSYTGAIIGVYVGGSKTKVHWLNPEAQQRYDAVQRAFPHQEVWVYGWSADGSRTLARVQTPSTPPVYYLVDFKTHHADIAADEYPALEGATLGEFREITYKARDGTAIPAYLTLPPGKRTGPGPLVVLPHGGPQARDYPGFDWVAQFLATRGYAVLQPQFRGSTGFGEAFERAGYRQWGGVMQDDVSDGVRAMIDQGIADAHRVCIVGLSYGGYAALAGAAFTPDLYRCAVSVAGISDLRALMQSAVPNAGLHAGRVISTAESVWKERIGEETDPRLGTKSPINSVAAIRVPVMIAYGTGDGVVPIEQSTRMAEALEKAGKPVTVVKLPDEDHWLSQAQTRTQLLEALESFLKQYL
jgi:dipeptidyl aminopeptidase/acylaminoacyl peptidase